MKKEVKKSIRKLKAVALSVEDFGLEVFVEFSELSEIAIEEAVNCLASKIDSDEICTDFFNLIQDDGADLSILFPQDDDEDIEVSCPDPTLN
jgi:hypothetical protein